MTDKLAVSAMRTLGVLKARAAQGAAVGAPAMHMAQQAAGSASTPAALRRLALGAGEDVRAARQTAAFANHPIPAARRAAAETVHGLEETAPWRMFEMNRMDGKTLELPWSSAAKRRMLFGTGAELHDPAGLIPRPPPPVSGYAKTITAPTPGPQFPLPQTPRPEAATAARHRRPAGPSVPVDPALAPTQITGRPVQPAKVQRAPEMPPPPRAAQRPLIPAAQPTAAEDVTVAKRRPKMASVAGDRDSQGTFTTPLPIEDGTGYEGRTQKIPVDPREQVSAAFDQQQRQLDTATPPEPKYAAHKLHGRMTFRGLPISIENRAGSHRHWHDPHTGRDGKTLMRYPYGYIRRTKGLDGDHVDVFIGPNEQAEKVYVILTNKAPHFEIPDEEKCMLGFDSEEEAKAAFHEHYDNPKFFRSMKTLSFDEFKDRVEDTFTGMRRKVAAAALWAPYFEKLGYDTGDSIREPWGPAPAHQGIPPEDLRDPRGGVEKSIGLPPVGAQRKIVGEGMAPDERVERQFRFADQPQSSTAVEGAWGAPEGAPVL